MIAPFADAGGPTHICCSGIILHSNGIAAASLYIHLAGRILDRNGLAICVLNGPCIVKICYGTVPGNGPGRFLVNINAAVSTATIARTAFVLNHGAFETAALCHI